MKTKYRSVFISDLHIGSNGCKSSELLNFLKSFTADNLYIVGDGIDALVLKSISQFTKTHYKIFKRLIKLSKKTSIFYCPGNHDSILRQFCGTRLHNFQLNDFFLYESLNGQKFIVLHGDYFDNELCKNKTFSKIVLFMYECFLAFNNLLNAILKILKKGPFCLINLSKIKIKQYLRRVEKFEKRLIDFAIERNYDGVICGHIHQAKIKSYQDVFYMNTGDWVDSCTALVEHLDGTWEIIYSGSGKPPPLVGGVVH